MGLLCMGLLSDFAVTDEEIKDAIEGLCGDLVMSPHFHYTEDGKVLIDGWCNSDHLRLFTAIAVQNESEGIDPESTTPLIDCPDCQSIGTLYRGTRRLGLKSRMIRCRLCNGSGSVPKVFDGL